MEDAVASQTLPGDDVLQKIPLGDVNKIQFRTLQPFNRTLNPNNAIDFSALPFKVQVNDVKSTFVTVNIYIDLLSANFTIEQRRYLPLFIDMWTKSPMIKNGTITDIGGVIKRYHKYLIKFQMGQSHSYVEMGGQMELSKLEEAISFIHDRIYYPYFNENDLKTTVNIRLNKGTPSATKILSGLLDGIYYTNQTFDHHTSHLVQKNFLTKIQQKIDNNQTQSIIDDLYTMARILGNSQKRFLHIAGNVQKLKEKYGNKLEIFSEIFNSTETNESQDELHQRYEFPKESGYRNEDKTLDQHVALGVDSTSSCFMTQTIMYNNTDWSLPEVRIF